jgi:hypothetical protein
MNTCQKYHQSRKYEPDEERRSFSLGAPYDRGKAKHQRHFTQTIPCISRTVIGQHGHSLPQDSMPDDH